MRLVVILSIAIGCITVHAGDDRFGFATHFEQGWPPNPVMQMIASTGVSYIRDDLYAGSWEPSTGVYVQPSRDMAWLNAAKANGLKVVGILGPNWHYKDNYNPPTRRARHNRSRSKEFERQRLSDQARRRVALRCR